MEDIHPYRLGIHFIRTERTSLFRSYLTFSWYCLKSLTHLYKTCSKSYDNLVYFQYWSTHFLSLTTQKLESFFPKGHMN